MNSVVAKTRTASAVGWPNLAGNALVFQGLWFAAIFDFIWVAGLCVAVLLVQGVMASWSSSLWRRLAAVAILGMSADATFTYLGWYQFPDDAPLSTPIPLWLSLLWLGFVCTLPLSLRWILNRPAVSTLVFAVAGCFSYAAGRALGALTFEDGVLLATASLWACVGLLSSLLFGLTPRQSEAS
ncbi:MAG: DUF2878 domain-containing protein [Oleiphilaceae bacterium]|nr:DUF2878 domain-containing protein [Oleiphilaceae bacterium]